MLLVAVMLVTQCTRLLGEDQTLVQTKDGKVRGELVTSDRGREAVTWQSIPFAEPPIGELRLDCSALFSSSKCGNIVIGGLCTKHTQII